ncbi:MAG: N-formylglutamate amidohydrolase [Alphaproteobacteria bacterium]|nr:N-formylglutamate amidohydrolase [Alphaproteobacteria bacterium]
MSDVFSISPPQTAALPLIYDSPHSGNAYPDDFNYSCDFNILKSAEDNFVEDLFNACTAHGAHFLQAHFPRSYIDPNRKIDDIDSELLGNHLWQGPFPIMPSPRSHAGIGLIRRLVRPGIPVYDRALESHEILSRIERCYIPYHQALKTLIAEAHYNFGQIWHINCHSMPASSAYPKTATGLTHGQAQSCDFVLGDRDGTSCAPDFTRELRTFLQNLGYNVTINDPYKGVVLVDQYSNPAMGYHSLQIEINKALYMDETTNTKNSNYSSLKNDIDKMNNFIADFVGARLMRLAAD